MLSAMACPRERENATEPGMARKESVEAIVGESMDRGEVN
jgi:hypothetical protein